MRLGGRGQGRRGAVARAAGAAGAATRREAEMMRRAAALARRAEGRTHPNPLVGCVVLDRDGEVAGEGFHPRAGEPHAEVYALRAAGRRAEGGTAVVTLEPCSHFGRTPPCARALVESGVARVVVGMQDPNPLVSGRGVERLRTAGVDVVVGVEEEEVRALNPEFIARMSAVSEVE